ncbi:MAG: hypothetical protein ACFFBD_07660 [Candidatus Hodarchaeota archaeon]
MKIQIRTKTFSISQNKQITAAIHCLTSKSDGLIRKTDRVIVLDNRKIVEQGTFNELLEK